MKKGQKRSHLKKVTVSDVIIAVFLILCALCVIIPIYNVIVISLATE